MVESGSYSDGNTINFLFIQLWMKLMVYVYDTIPIRQFDYIQDGIKGRCNCDL